MNVGADGIMVLAAVGVVALVAAFVIYRLLAKR
jgi:hypothetical protein